MRATLDHGLFLGVTFLLVCALGAPAHAQQPALTLTLRQAVELALKNNPAVLVTAADVQEAAAARTRHLAARLPHVTADALVNRQNRNLAVVGLSIPNIPTVVGPFSFMDFRVSFSQSLVDRQAYHEWKASAKAEESAQMTHQDSRDLVIRQAAGLYLASEAGAAELEAAEARVVTAAALEKLARDQRDQQLATGLDVVRAQVQLARERQNALAARDAYQTSLIALARFLGLDLGQPLELAESLRFVHVEAPDVEGALTRALAMRPDYQALARERDSLDEQQHAVHARDLPRLSLSGDYGALGRNFGSLPGIGEVQATVSVSVFDRDRSGATEELRARRTRLDEQLNDLARGIEQELRTAILNLDLEEQEVKVADAAVELGERELAMTEDRFRNGVSDNIEVVAAQETVARVHDQRIAALARHADARMALVRALGNTEDSFARYMR